MTIIKLKRVYEEYEEEDGARILVDRLWPRGIRKEDLHYDIWAKEVAPSAELRQWLHENKEEHWDDFVTFYKKELLEGETLTPFVHKIRDYQVVTLLYAAKDKSQNHVLVLKDVLEQQLSLS